ncbi:MAG: penicillin-binding protein [Fervidobacterium sp.]|nr:penicillin-binding protein [Fervidobacterium sp.]
MHLKKLILFLVLFVVFLFITFSICLQIYRNYTAKLELPVNKTPASLTVEYSDGTPLYTPKNIWVDYEDIPAMVKDSIIASEDRRFYSHSGVDIKGIIRSLFVIITTDEVQGGSTITQQLARTLYLSQERTWKRKIKEIFIALWLEQNYSKEEILEMYVNSVYLGNGLYGFPAAAKHYFGKTLDELQPVEIAMLVSTLRSPEKANPSKDLNVEFSRITLRKMKENGVISESEYQNALSQLSAENVKNFRKQYNSFDEDLFWMIVLELKELNFDLSSLRNGFRVRTTIDKRLQSLLQNNIDKRNMAGLIIEHSTGKIRAAYGLGINSGKRQIGSIVKPLYYYLAFMAGRNKSDILQDKPITIGTWTPQNFDKEYWQEVTLENALIYSRNVPSVNLFMQLGQSNVRNFLKNRLMIEGYYPNDATISLGTVETSLFDISKGFQPIFNGGVIFKPKLIEFVRDKDGITYYTYKPEILNVIKPLRSFDQRAPLEAAVLTLQLMEKVVTMGTGKSAYIPGRKIYGKTGTAEKNAWFVGGDGKYLFLLTKDGKNLTGGKDVAPIWKKIALDTDIGTTPISLPIQVQIPAITRSKEPSNQESQTSTSTSENLTQQSVGLEKMYENVKNKTITSDEIVNILKTLDSDKQREILSKINEIDPYMASEVYEKLLGGGEF